MGKKSAPAPDPRIGDAAMASAANGKDYLDFMKNQASVTNGWATEDRKRYQDTFVPLQDQFIKDAQEWDSPAREAARVDQNRAAVSGNIATAQGMQQRQMAAMGVSPNSGRAAAVIGSLRETPGCHALCRRKTPRLGDCAPPPSARTFPPRCSEIFMG